MEPEQNPPWTLVECLNDETQLEVFNEWRLGEGKDVPRALAVTNVRYDEQRADFIRKGDPKDMNRAIANYMKQRGVSVNPQTCTWSDVLQQMDKAVDEWKARGKWRLRHGSGIERNLLPLLEAIPSDNGLGVLKAGLVIIFSAVKRRSDACERIIECFVDIPRILAAGHERARINCKEPKLRLKVEELHNALLDNIPSLIDILLRQDGGPAAKGQRNDLKRFTRGIASRFKDVTGNPVKEVEDLIARITKAAADLEEWANLLDSGKLEGIKQSLSGVVATGQANRLTLSSICSGMTSIGHAVDEIRKDLKQRSESEERGRNLEQRTKALEDTLLSLINGFYRLFAEQERVQSNNESARTGRSSTPSRAIEAPRPQASRTLWGVGFNELLVSLATREEHMSRYDDRDRVMSQMARFSSSAMRRLRSVANTPEHRAWQTSASSELMVIDGNCIQEAVGVVSPMSIFCVGLAQAVGMLSSSPESGRAGGRAATLLFLCGEHVSPSGRLAGPRGMMRGLIIQLLTDENLQWNPRRDGRGIWTYSRKPDLGFIAESETIWPQILKHSHMPELRDAYHNLFGDTSWSAGDAASSAGGSLASAAGGGPSAEQQYLYALLDIFAGLIRQLPRDTVLYCILDGVSYFETAEDEAWQAELTNVIDTLVEIWSSQRTGAGTGATLKVLIANPGRSFLLPELINPTDTPGALYLDLSTAGAGALGREETSMGLQEMLRRDLEEKRSRSRSYREVEYARTSRRSREDEDEWRRRLRYEDDERYYSDGYSDD